MTWSVDDSCEVLVGGRWVAASVHAIESAGPRVRVDGTGKLMRPGPGKIRSKRPAVIVRGAPPAAELHEETPPERTVAAAMRQLAPLVAQPKPQTPRDERFLDHLRGMTCCACGAPPRSEAAHFGPDRGVGLKASDYEACALCVDCHRHWHNHGVLPARDRSESMRTQWMGALRGLLFFPAVTLDEDAIRELAQLAAVHVRRLRRAA